MLTVFLFLRKHGWVVGTLASGSKGSNPGTYFWKNKNSVQFGLWVCFCIKWSTGLVIGITSRILYVLKFSSARLLYNKECFLYI
jgi:hypothetical protein